MLLGVEATGPAAEGAWHLQTGVSLPPACQGMQPESQRPGSPGSQLSPALPLPSLPLPFLPPWPKEKLMRGEKSAAHLRSFTGSSAGRTPTQLQARSGSGRLRLLAGEAAGRQPGCSRNRAGVSSLPRRLFPPPNASAVYHGKQPPTLVE